MKSPMRSLLYPGAEPSVDQSRCGLEGQELTRVETFGFPYTHWVRAIVDPRDPKVFSFREEIVKENLVNH